VYRQCFPQRRFIVGEGAADLLHGMGQLAAGRNEVGGDLPGVASGRQRHVVDVDVKGDGSGETGGQAVERPQVK
jgi:hypothetical protein